MTSEPRIILHNDRTSHMGDWLRRADPDADFRECTSYDALPALIDSYHPDIIYSVRFSGSPDYPRDSIFWTERPPMVCQWRGRHGSSG